MAAGSAQNGEPRFIRHVGEAVMWDAIFVALTIALIALSIAYTRACDKV
jgi:hypothetical protein